MQQITSNSLSGIALQRFKKNFWGVLSFWFIVGCIGVAIFAYLLAPDNSQNANQMHLSIHSKPPGFKVSILTIPAPIEASQSFVSKLFFGVKNMDNEIPVETYSAVEKGVKISTYSEGELTDVSKIIPLDQFPKGMTSEEVIDTYVTTKTFVLGTDKYGRDLLSRMLVGIRISLSIGFVAVFISLVLGIALGAVSGYFGGKIDRDWRDRMVKKILK